MSRIRVHVTSKVVVSLKRQLRELTTTEEVARTRILRVGVVYPTYTTVAHTIGSTKN